MAKEALRDAKSVESTENKLEAIQQQAPKKGRKDAQESVYSVSELADNAGKLFGTRQECVVTALKAAGKMECTVSDAKKIVSIFLKREVE